MNPNAISATSIDDSVIKMNVHNESELEQQKNNSLTNNGIHQKGQKYNSSGLISGEDDKNETDSGE